MIPFLFAVIYLAILVLSGFVFSQTARFAKEHPTIDSARTLEAFKGLARTNMKLALVLLPLYGVGILLTLVLVVRYGLLGLAACLGVNALIGVLGLYGMRLEKTVRSLPAASEELRQEHRRVAESWVKKALPDF